MDSNYLILCIGIILFGIGLFVSRKDREQAEEFQLNLEEKEKNLYDLYNALEEILNEIQRVYNDNNKNIKNETFELPNERDNILTIYNKDKESQSSHKRNTVYSKPRVKKSENQDIKVKTVMNLFNQGNSIENIAKILNIGKGEVTLILGVIKKQEV